MTALIRLTDQPSVGAQTSTFGSCSHPTDSTNTETVTAARHAGTHLARIVPTFSVEETIRFAGSHYDRALRKLAD